MSETLAPDDAASRLDEEDIRLTTGFADIFTTIVLVVGASALLAATGPFGGLLVIAAAFGLGKPIVRVRQYAAASSALAIGVAFGAATFGVVVAGIFGFLVAAGASAFYWRTFRVPIALALGWAGVALVVSLLLTTGFQINLGPGPSYANEELFGLTWGAQLLALAVWYDSRDRMRRGRLSDAAFWLHLASAPLLVHGLFAAMETNPFAGEVAEPWLVLAVFGVLTLASLVLDRRPLLVSSFIYLMVAVGTLLAGFRGETQGAERLAAASLAPAVIGAFLLVLAAFWTGLRNAVLRMLPEAATRFVPPAGGPSAPPNDQAGLPAAEKEPMRLVLGFNDIFVSAGSTMMFLGSIALAYHLTRPRWESLNRYNDVILSTTPWVMVAVPALSLWLVAEYFVRVRRMAWPAITTAVWFSLVCWAAGLLAAWSSILQARPGSWVSGGEPPFRPSAMEPLVSAIPHAPVLIACGVATAGNLLFWRRHRTPISFALAVASLLPLAFIDFIVAPASSRASASDGTAWMLRLLLAGSVTFALAMLWDRSDPERKTQRSDTAFWLHLLASSFAIPALYRLALQTGFGLALVTVGFVLVIAAAVAIDRRAPLVVALPFAISVIGSETGIPAVATVALCLGLLALVLRWDRARSRLLSLVAARAATFG